VKINKLQKDLVLNLLLLLCIFFTATNFLWAAVYWAVKGYSLFHAFALSVYNWLLFVLGLIATALVVTVQENPDFLKSLRRQRKKPEEKQKPKKKTSKDDKEIPLV